MGRPQKGWDLLSHGNGNDLRVRGGSRCHITKEVVFIKNNIREKRRTCVCVCTLSPELSISAGQAG